VGTKQAERRKAVIREIRIREMGIREDNQVRERSNSRKY
jgi:hypothetical protein